jgi:S1-C subfamily serine protease
MVLGSGTGVLISAAGKTFLITNYHVLSGKHPYTDQMLEDAAPDFLEVSYRVKTDGFEIPAISRVVHPLYDDNHEPNYLSYPVNERQLPVEASGVKFGIDVAVLEVTNIPHNAGLLAFERSNEFHLPVMDKVGIVGFPFDLSGTENFPIWLTGTVASDLANRPYRKYFLVDSRTKPSCSGSLVVLKINGASLNFPGGKLDNQGNTIHTLGIYSGRIKDELDIGIVWHWNTVEQLLESKIPLPQQSWKSLAERTGATVKTTMQPPSKPKP